MADKRSPVIETQDLTKIFSSDDVTAVDNINFGVESGDVFGFLGPNGAGKTTTIKMLCGALDPTSGTAIVGGHDIEKEPLKMKEKIGVMPEEPGFYENMTGRQHLKFYAEFHNLEDPEKNIQRSIEISGIKEYVDRKVKGYSHGMRKRLALAQAIVHQPQVLILDEPTGGLDPQGTHFFKNMVEKLNDDGKTIFLSSHILSEVQEVCNRVGIIHEGKILEVDLIENLSRAMANQEKGYEVNVEGKGIENEILDSIKEMNGVRSIEKTDRGFTAMIEDEDLSSKINSKLIEEGAEIKSINVKEPDLEEVFLKITENKI
ncbi:MAG: ATP-binding cassette domain-containing protein [Thermoplasmata archaeon]